MSAFLLLSPSLARAQAAPGSVAIVDQGSRIQDAPPLAGYHNGLFYLRDSADVFRLYIQGRVHVDALTWLAPGVASLPADSGLKSTLTLRRARLEIAGEFFHDWQWQLSADFAPLKYDDPAAKLDTPSCTINAMTSAQTCANQSNAVEAPSVAPAATDAFVNYGPSPWFNVQAGQYLLPFMLENRISDNTTTFLERSLVVRSLAAPYTRELGAMIWGAAPRRHVYYTVGVYNGDGPNRPNADSRFDFVGRTFVRPFVGAKSPLHDAQIGISGKLGSRDAKEVGYDVPSMTTQSGYSFWKATYRDSQSRLLHIIPSAQQAAVGAELYVPIDGFDLQSEFIYSYSQTREAVDGYQLSPFTERLGTLKGYGLYVQAGYWLVGSRSIIGLPSYGRPLHADLTTPDAPAEHGLEAIARFERLLLSYEGASRGGISDALTPNGNIEVDAVTLGINYWATRHLRVGLNYGFYSFPGSEPTTASTPGAPVQTSAQRATAPAQALVKGTDDDARENSHVLHEIQARVGVQF